MTTSGFRLGWWGCVLLFCLGPRGVVALEDPQVSTLHAQGLSLIEDDSPRFFVSPRFGMARILGANTLNSEVDYGFGISAGIEVWRNIALEFAYQRAQLNMGLPFNALNSLPVVTNAPGNVFQMGQNQFFMGAKVHLLDRSYRLRPVVGAGAGFSRSELNYHPMMLSALGQPSVYDRDVRIDQWLGYASGGLELQISPHFSIFGVFQYNGVLSGKVNAGQSVDAQIAANADPNKTTLANGILRAASYAVNFGVTLSF